MPIKYNVWFFDKDTRPGYYNPDTYGTWVNQGDGPMGKKTAERIARELHEDFGSRTQVLPDGSEPAKKFNQPYHGEKQLRVLHP
jgi:hypothetical protein